MTMTTFRFDNDSDKTFQAVSIGDWNGFASVLVPASQRDALIAAADGGISFDSATGSLVTDSDDVIDCEIADGFDECVYNLNGFCVVAADVDCA